MRILAIYKHYWPDTTPYARLLRAILEDTVEQGHQATVFTAQPAYNDIHLPDQPAYELLGGVAVHRIRLLPEKKQDRLRRALNFVIFLLRSIWFLTKDRRYDLILANSHPPVLMGWTLRLINQFIGIPYVIHCQDIHPEAAGLAAQLRTGVIYHLLRAIDTRNCVKALRVVTLSQDMKNTLLQRPGARDNIEVINNFALDRYGSAEQVVPELFRASGPFRVLFAGNLGHYQNLSQLMSAILLLKDQRDIHFIFMGKGVMAEPLRRQAGDLLGKTVFFEPFRPVEVAFQCMRRSNLGVVCLGPGVSRVAYPSKSMTLLAAGCPLLTLVERQSQLARETIAHNLGYIASNSSPAEIASCILAAFQDRDRWTPEARAELADRAAALFSRESALQAWEFLLATLEPAVRAQPELGCEPIIIIGAARSGTNMLRDMLVKLPAVATWPCDEINYIWRHGNALHKSDEFPETLATPRVRNFIRKAFIAQWRKQRCRFLVEKTCANSLRVGFVNAVVPEAKFIFLVRDGRDAAASAMLRWRAPLNLKYTLKKARFVPPDDLLYYAMRYASHRASRLLSREKRLSTWGPRFEGMESLAKRPLEEICAYQWARSVEVAREQLQAYPGRVYQLRYEDLVRDPKTELGKVIRFLGFEVAPQELARAVSGVSDRSVGKFRDVLSEQALARIESILLPQLEALGYSASSETLKG